MCEILSLMFCASQLLHVNNGLMLMQCVLLTGLLDAEGHEESAVQSSAPFVEQHDVSTPVMTPPKSVTPTLRTPSPSLSEPPVVHAAAKPPPTLPATQLLPTSKEPAVKMVDAATECGL